ncbi:MAG: ferredoxin [bacterium]|nr:ferredoxin [bacterium]
MKAVVDQDACISCGMCVSTCPEVFEFDDNEKAHAVVDVVPGELEDSAQEAADGCPTDAISVD